MYIKLFKYLQNLYAFSSITPTHQLKIDTLVYKIVIYTLFFRRASHLIRKNKFLFLLFGLLGDLNEKY